MKRPARNFLKTYARGYTAGFRNEPRDSCPYRDVRGRNGMTTWARAWRRFWLEGWEDGTLGTVWRYRKTTS